jgi:hypothetical protein
VVTFAALDELSEAMIASSSRTTRPTRCEVGRPGAERRTLVTVERDKAAAQLTKLSEITSERPPSP